MTDDQEPITLAAAARTGLSEPNYAAFQDAVVIASREHAQAALDRERRGYIFPLPATSGRWTADDPHLPDPSFVGHARAVARVRRVPMIDLMTSGALSTSMQSTVMMAFEDVNQMGDAETDGGFAVADVIRATTSQKEMARGIAIAGFLEPWLVETPEEAEAADDPRVLWVDELQMADLLAYLNLVMNLDSEAAKALAPFPDAGLAGAATGQAGAAAAQPERDRAPARGEGIQLVAVPGV